MLYPFRTIVFLIKNGKMRTNILIAYIPARVFLESDNRLIVNLPGNTG